MAPARMLARLLNYRLAGLAFAWIAALAVVAWLVFSGRDASMRSAWRATAGIATIVEQQTAQSFQAIHLTLDALAEAYALRNPPTNDAQFREMMLRRLNDLPFVRAIYVVGPDGSVIHDTDYPRTPNVLLADRPYFQEHQRNPAFRGAVWPPLLSRSGTGWFLPVTHPLGRSGRFEGLLAAAVQADHFRDRFRSIGLGDDYLIAFFHLDGTLVASHPPLDDVGKRYPHLPIFDESRLEARSGTFWTRESPMPGERLVSYRVLEHEPFVVHVSRARSDVLAEWRSTATGAAIAMLALTLFLAGFVAHLTRESWRRERERHRRAQAEKMEALGQLTGGIAHDFTNLLAIVTMNMTLLRRQPEDREQIERALATTERAVASGMQLVERLLAFARRRPLSVSRVRLGGWLEAARPLLEQAAGRGVTVEIEVVPPLPQVLCDTAELDTAVVNLVINARDAMAGAGRVHLRAYACTEESGAPRAFVANPVRFVCLTVRDTGPGMTEEVRRRAMEPFYTTKGEAGTGLGLSQVYGFIHQLGGQMNIESTPGGGTAVHLFFPVAPPDPEAQP